LFSSLAKELENWEILGQFCCESDRETMMGNVFDRPGLKQSAELPASNELEFIFPHFHEFSFDDLRVLRQCEMCEILRRHLARSKSKPHFHESSFDDLRVLEASPVAGLIVLLGKSTKLYMKQDLNSALTSTGPSGDETRYNGPIPRDQAIHIFKALNQGGFRRPIFHIRRGFRILSHHTPVEKKARKISRDLAISD
jgi:hypothetical protein